jgi:hypothetical protein
MNSSLETRVGLQGAVEADRGPMDLISVQLGNAGFLSSPLFKHMSLFPLASQ